MTVTHIMAQYLPFPQHSYEASLCHVVTSNVPSLSTYLNPNSGKYLWTIS